MMPPARCRPVVLALVIAGAGAISGLAGCSTAPVKPIELNPALATIKADFAAVDARPTVEISERVQPPPKQTVVVSKFIGPIVFTLSGGRTVAQFVAEAARTVAPNITAMKVTQFEVRQTMGLWAGALWCDVSAEVTLADGRMATIPGKGKNTIMAPLNPRNWEIAIERAMEDFESNLKKVAVTP